MKISTANLLLSLLFLLIACGEKSTISSKADFVPSAQKYNKPIFDDSLTFRAMIVAYPAVEKVYRKYMKENHLPSLSFGIIANGQLVYWNSLGQSNLEKETKATSKTLYRIASMSKSFTAMAILKLRDEGKLRLTDSVSKYIPDFVLAGSLTKDAPAINIQHLLTMSAGFPEDNPWGDRQLDDTDEELLEFVSKKISFSNVAGIKFEYSNLGYALLGKIITNVSGMPYQKYITQNILKPLGMNDSKWEYSDVPDEQLAHGYRWEDNRWKEEPILHDGAYGAMGGLICSIEDFSKYVSLHLSAWPPRDDADMGPIKRSSIREMHQPWRFNNLIIDAKNRMGENCPEVSGYGYGLGWRKDCMDKVRISHSGGLPGFGSEWRIYPDYGVGVVSFSNLTYGAPSAANAIALDTLIKIASLKPRRLFASDILKQRKNELIQLFSQWNESKLNIFAENFFLDKSKEQWKKELEDIFSKTNGKLFPSDLIAENQLRGSFMIRCSVGLVEIHFTLTPESKAKIQELKIKVFGFKK